MLPEYATRPVVGAAFFDLIFSGLDERLTVQSWKGSRPKSSGKLAKVSLIT